MVRGILFFLIMWALVVGSIASWRALSGKERWSLVKTVTYGGFTAVIALIVIVGIVVLF